MMAEGCCERPPALYTALTKSLRSGPSHSSKARVSGLTSRQLREHHSSKPAPSVRLVSISGRRICLPGVSTVDRDWSVPGRFLVRALVGTLVFVVGDDGGVDSNGERFRVSAVIVSSYRCVAPESFALCECSDEQDLVTVVFGSEVAEFVGMPFEECELIDLSNVATPPSPASPCSWA